MSSLADLFAPGPSEARLHFVDESVVATLGSLWNQSEVVAAWSQARGCAPVAAALSNSSASITTLIGLVRAGPTLVSIPGPPRGADAEWYKAFVVEACRQSGADALLVDAKLLPLLPHIEGIHISSYEEVLTFPSSRAATAPEEFRLIQFTSGSTAQPKGICLSQDKIVANVRAILDRVGPEPGDGACSWLPLSHDMGLIGMFFTSLAANGSDWADGGEMVIMTPEGFLRNPSRWLTICAEFGSTITASPGFGFDAATKRPPVAAIDLGRLRVCITGAEQVRPSVLADFSASFRELGFRDTAFCPAYGLAEATLAVSMVAPEEAWSVTELNRDRLTEGEVVTTAAGTGFPVVNCGRPVQDVMVKVEAAEGIDGGVGEICIQGPSLFDGYSDAGSGRAENEWFRTSDQGFVRDGSLFLLGRSDEVFLSGGRKVYASDIEAEVGEVAGVRRDRVLVAEGDDREIVILVEPDFSGSEGCSSMHQAGLARDIRRAVVRRVGVAPRAVGLVAKGRLPLTASGKPRRVEAVRQFTSGTLELLSASRE